MSGAFKVVLLAGGTAKKPSTPIMQYAGYGSFNISNYNSNLVYTARLITGSGSANLNVGTGNYSLSSVTARFSITAKYPGASIESDLTYMERLAYERSYTQQCAPGCTNGFACCSEANWVPCDCAAPGTPGYSPNDECGCTPRGLWGRQGWGCKDPECCGFGLQCQQVDNGVINQPGYTNSGSEWYKVNQ